MLLKQSGISQEPRGAMPRTRADRPQRPAREPGGQRADRLDEPVERADESLRAQADFAAERVVPQVRLREQPAADDIVRGDAQFALRAPDGPVRGVERARARGDAFIERGDRLCEQARGVRSFDATDPVGGELLREEFFEFEEVVLVRSRRAPGDFAVKRARAVDAKVTGHAEPRVL